MSPCMGPLQHHISHFICHLLLGILLLAPCAVQVSCAGDRLVWKLLLNAGQGTTDLNVNKYKKTKKQLNLL